MVITSKSNPIVKKAASLADKKYRKLYGLYLVDGLKPVREAFKAGCEIDTLIVSESVGKDFCKEFLPYQNVVTVSDSVFKSLSEEKTPQGVMAEIKIPQKKLSAPEASCLLLDRIQDPGNMGTIIRTANAAGYREIYLLNCTDPYSPKAVRASMSGVFFVDLYVADQEEIFGALDGVPLISADMDGEDIFRFSPPEKFCLCIGNEGHGISEEVKERSKYTVKIPMRETCESLNAGVSAGIAMIVLKNKMN